MSDLNTINVQPIFDLKKHLKQNKIYDDIQMEDSDEERKMDLWGYYGDQTRHRKYEGNRKRVALTEDELVQMMHENDRLKEIALALRDIDPDRNGYVT